MQLFFELAISFAKKSGSKLHRTAVRTARRTATTWRIYLKVMHTKQLWDAFVQLHVKTLQLQLLKLHWKNHCYNTERYTAAVRLTSHMISISLNSFQMNLFSQLMLPSWYTQFVSWQQFGLHFCNVLTIVFEVECCQNANSRIATNTVVN